MFLNNCILNGDSTLYSSVENTTMSYFESVMDYMFSITQNAYSLDQYGSVKADKEWDKANDIMYLQVYLEIVYLTIRQDIANSSSPCGDPNITYDNYNKKFNLDCIKKHFRCLGINPDPLFALYGITQPLGGGINYDSISLGDCSILTIQ